MNIEGDSTGYSVILSAYTEAQTKKMLEKADELFVENGLAKPTSFRAGGWSAELHTLKALAETGYVADTSANNWRRLEEWIGIGNGLYEWNKGHWSTINDTSQPYYPSVTDILVSEKPALSILEVPDNGILVDYVSAEEMIEIFMANWGGSTLEAPVAYSLGYHTSNFDSEYKERMDGILNYIDQYLAVTDGGPVIYTTLSELPKVWKP